MNKIISESCFDFISESVIRSALVIFNKHCTNHNMVIHICEGQFMKHCLKAANHDYAILNTKYGTQYWVSEEFSKKHLKDTKKKLFNIGLKVIKTEFGLAFALLSESEMFKLLKKMCHCVLKL